MPSVVPSVCPQSAGGVVCGGWHLPYSTSHPPPCTGLLLSFWDFSAPLLAPGRDQAMLAPGVGGSWCEVLCGVLCVLIFCLKRSIKKIERENFWKREAIILPQAGRTPYKKLCPLEWLVVKLQFRFCGFWLPESTVSRPLRPAAEMEVS